MRFRQAWSLSKYPYVEVAFRSIQLAQGGNVRGLGRSDPQRAVRSTIRSAWISKGVFAIFVCLGNAIPFIGFFLNHTPVALVSGIALSLAVSLAYVVLYSLQVLPSLAGAAPYSLLRTLPFSRNDLSLVTLLSFLRAFDFPAIGAIIVSTTVVGLATGSILAAGLMFGAAIVNIVFAVAISLWFSGLFYRNMTRGGRSKTGTILRGVFLVTWGLAALSTWFIFNFLTQLLPTIEAVITGDLSQPIGLILTFLPMFASSITIASALYPNLLNAASSLPGGSLFFAGLNYAASALYAVLAVVVARWTLHKISTITLGEGVKIVREKVKDFSLRIRRPFTAYVMKDLRVASKNPSTAILFALPIFMLVVIYLSIPKTENFGILEIVIATILGAFLTVTGATALLTTERTGLEFTMSMPIGSRTIINAKSLIATLIYTPVPFLILGLVLIARASLSLSLIPFLEIMAIAAATTMEIAVFINSQKRPRRSSGGAGYQRTGLSLMSGSSLLILAGTFVLAFVIIMAPLISYFVVALLASSSAALASTGLTAVAELLIVQAVVRMFR